MQKPHIAFIVNQPNWAYDFVARSIRNELKGWYKITIIYSLFHPRDFSHEDYDLVYVFYWGDQWASRQAIPSYKKIQEVASLRWIDEMSPEDFLERYLKDACLITTPSRQIYDLLKPVTDRITLAYNGVETSIFSYKRKKGSLKIGWVGAEGDKSKGFEDILKPACRGRFELVSAGGGLNRHQVAELYKRVDVIAIASISESQPLPLLEGMACGCFPVSTSVGLVPEIITNGTNGLIVNRDVESFREAFSWCEKNLELVREAGRANADYIISDKSWQHCAGIFCDLFKFVMEGSSAQKPSTSLGKSKIDGRSVGIKGNNLSQLCNRIAWKFSDMKTELQYLNNGIKTIGLIQFIRKKFMSRSWWARRFKSK